MSQDLMSVRFGPAYLFSVLILPGITKPFLRWDSVPGDGAVSNSLPTPRSC